MTVTPTVSRDSGRGTYLGFAAGILRFCRCYLDTRVDGCVFSPLWCVVLPGTSLWPVRAARVYVSNACGRDWLNENRLGRHESNTIRAKKTGEKSPGRNKTRGTNKTRVVRRVPCETNTTNDNDDEFVRASCAIICGRSKHVSK